MGRNVFQTTSEQSGANRFGLWLFLSALAILFGAALLVMLAIRLEAVDWPDDLPPLPGVLWWSTGVLIASGVSMQWGVLASRKEQLPTMRVALSVSLCLALAFLLMQVIAWQEWTGSMRALTEQDEGHRLAGTGLLVLIGLHGAHIIAGLIPLAVVVWCALVRGVAAPLLRSTAIYWHFVDVIWFVLVIFMLCVFY